MRDGRRRTFYLGAYSSLTLHDAREAARTKATKVRAPRRGACLASSVQRPPPEPGVAPVTFAAAAEQVTAARSRGWSRPEHTTRVWMRTFERHVFPLIGSMSVSDVGTDHSVRVLERLEALPRARQIASAADQNRSAARSMISLSAFLASSALRLASSPTTVSASACHRVPVRIVRVPASGNPYACYRGTSCVRRRKTRCRCGGGAPVRAGTRIYYSAGSPESVAENAARSNSSNSVVGSCPYHWRHAIARASSSVRAATTRRAAASGCSTRQYVRGSGAVITGSPSHRR